jgi:hypothetical protein
MTTQSTMRECSAALRARQSRRLLGSALTAFEESGVELAAGLLLDDLPGQQVVGNGAPRRARAHGPVLAVGVLAQWVATLRRFFGHQRQVGARWRHLLSLTSGG